MIKKMQQFQKQASFGVSIVLIIAIAIVFNYLSYQLFVRFDLTQNKDYSISAASKKSVSELDDVVNIKAYFSKNLPSQYIQVRQEVSDLLSEYENYSRGKVRVEFIEPTEASKEQLYMKGIPELQFQVTEKDKLQVVNGYVGLTISYGDKTETIPVIESTDNFEYTVTSKIRKVTADELPVLGLVTSNQALSQEAEIKTAIEALRSLYEVRDVDLSVATEIDKGIKTLLILGTKEKYKDEDLKKIDKYLVSGGSAVFAIDGVKVDKNLTASDNDLSINGLLKKYGLEIGTGLVLDASASNASFNQGFMTFSLPYPFWPKIVKTGFNKDSAAVAKLETATFPWVSQVSILKDNLGAGKVVELIKTSKKSWIVKDKFDLNPDQKFNPSEFSQYAIAVERSGEIKSAYGSETTDKSRLIVIGDSDFLQDSFAAGGRSDNLDLFLNLVDSVTLDSELNTIRAKGVSSHPLNRELTDSERNSLRYGNIFGVTILVLGFGLYRYYSRRKKQLDSL